MINKYTLTHTGAELDEAAGIIITGHDSTVAAFDLFIADLTDPSGYDISHGAVDSIIGAIVSG